jgi:hypothetical protein
MTAVSDQAPALSRTLRWAGLAALAAAFLPRLPAVAEPPGIHLTSLAAFAVFGAKQVAVVRLDLLAATATTSIP